MKHGIKVLLGAVPFGENNVGDEAILESVVGIVREVCPDADIRVSTSDRAGTARKFGVETVPLFGFDAPYSKYDLDQAVAGLDLFIWSGATGLSDYPENATAVVDTARRAGAKTVLWGCGMNDELNPAKYKTLPGRRQTLLRRITKLTGGSFDAISNWERHLETRARSCIRKTVSAADLVVTRDFPSREQLQRSGVEREILVGADSAIKMQSANFDQIALRASTRELLSRPTRKVGICISAQREVDNRYGLVRFLDQVVADGSTEILFIPMNPLTDSKLMAELRGQMQYPERTGVMSGYFDPQEVTAIAARMDLVIASRLHLLILGSIAHVPMIGIARGSKVDNFLEPYGLKPAGSVDDCDFDALWTETQRLLNNKASFQERSAKVRTEQLARLSKAMEELRKVFQSIT